LQRQDYRDGSTELTAPSRTGCFGGDVGYWHLADKQTLSQIGRYWTNNGQNSERGLNILVANDPKRTADLNSTTTAKTTVAFLSTPGASYIFFEPAIWLTEEFGFVGRRLSICLIWAGVFPRTS
jgi:hypothetical protein